jgi:hypothetical protein
MDDLLIIHSLGFVSEARSPQLKTVGFVSEARSLQLKTVGFAIDEAGKAMITYQVNNN